LGKINNYKNKWIHPPSRAQVKNVWSYSFSSPNGFMVWTEKPLHCLQHVREWTDQHSYYYETLTCRKRNAGHPLKRPGMWYWGWNGPKHLSPWKCSGGVDGNGGDQYDDVDGDTEILYEMTWCS
jgi:hypothetical protein